MTYGEGVGKMRVTGMTQKIVETVGQGYIRRNIRDGEENRRGRREDIHILCELHQSIMGNNLPLGETLHWTSVNTSDF